LILLPGFLKALPTVVLGTGKADGHAYGHGPLVTEEFVGVTLSSTPTPPQQPRKGFVWCFLATIGTPHLGP
jgi:hypothetical protein